MFVVEVCFVVFIHHFFCFLDLGTLYGLISAVFVWLVFQSLLFCIHNLGLKVGAVIIVVQSLLAWRLEALLLLLLVRFLYWLRVGWVKLDWSSDFMFLWLIFLVGLVYFIWRSGVVEDIMGTSSSKNRSSRSLSSSYDHGPSYGYPPSSPYPPQPAYSPQPTYTPSHPQYVPSPLPRTYAPPPPSAPRPKKTLERKYSRIEDNYRTLDEVSHLGLFLKKRWYSFAYD